MGLHAAKVLPVAGALALGGSMLVLLTVTRPEGAPAASAGATSPVAATATASTPTVTRTVPPPTATATPTVTPAPVVLPTVAPATRRLTGLTGLRLVDTVVLENNTSGDVFLPPGMPMEVVVGAKGGPAGETISFHFAPPPPFVGMNGTAGPGFNEEGGDGVATGTGYLSGVQATFVLEFSLSWDRFDGILRVTETGTGATIFALQWRGGGVEYFR